jgi:hypothetical protein
MVFVKTDTILAKFHIRLGLGGGEGFSDVKVFDIDCRAFFRERNAFLPHAIY